MTLTAVALLDSAARRMAGYRAAAMVSTGQSVTKCAQMLAVHELTRG